MEEFRTIKNYEDYQISNLGQVLNIKKNRFLKQSTHSNGYSVVSLLNSVSGNRLLIRVHRLVAEAFIPNPLNKLYVDHVDGNRQNNKVDNLRWAFNFENCQNRILPSNNKSGFKGVFYHKKSKKYLSYITCNKITTRLGSFGTLEEAKMMRQVVANKLFCEFTNACEKITNNTQVQLNMLLNDTKQSIEESILMLC